MMSESDVCSKSFETILYQSGKFGCYQRRLYGMVSLMHIVCSSIVTYLKFIPRQIRREKCVELLRPDENETILFLHANETVTYPVSCTEYYENDQGLEQDWVFPEWSFPEVKSGIGNSAHFSQVIGLAIGFIIGSILSDYLGRRRIMYVAFAVMCVGQCATSLSQTWIHFMICQGFAGTGAGCFILASMVLVLEYVGHDWRDICICLLPWWLGPSLLSLEGYCTRHWRYLALLSGGIGLPLLGTYLFIGAMVYCGLHRRVTHVVKDPYINNFVLYSTDVIVIFSAIMINKCIGRRWTIFLYAMSSGFISMCILVLHVTNESDIDESMINALGFFTKLGVTTSLTMVNLVTMEIYPTVIRTMGCAVGFTSGLAGYLLADKMILYLDPFHYTVPFVVYGVMMCILGIAALLLPETLRQPLPDILRCRHRNLCAHEPSQLTNGWSS